MKSLLGYLVVAVVAMAMTVNDVHGCSCMQTHPQIQFCKADFVMQVRLRAEGDLIYKKTTVNTTDLPGSNQIIQRYPVVKKYNVNIRKVFKVKANEFGLSKNSTVTEIYTAPSDSLCGVDLQQRTKYLVSGSFEGGQVPTLSLCGWNMPWAWVSKVQKKGLRYLYGQNCECQAVNSYFHSETALNSNVNNVCTWNPSRQDGDCFERQSACVLDKNSSTGGCKWLRNSRLKQCREESKGGRQEP